MVKLSSFFLLAGYLFFPQINAEEKKIIPESPSSVPYFPEPPAEQGDRFISEFISMLGTLGLILVLLLIISWLVKRFLNTRIQQLNTLSNIKIIDQRALSSRTSIYLLDIQGHDIVIAETTHGVTLLKDFHSNDSTAKT